METKAVINYTDYCIPEGHLSVTEYVKMLSDSFLTNIAIARDDLTDILKNSIGIRKIYVEDRQKEAEIYCTMLEKYFSKTNTPPDKIDFIIYARGDSVAHGNPWSMVDENCINVPYFLQNEFKMSKAQIFNVEQVCAGTVVGARIASSFIGDGAARKVLLFSSNFFKDPENRLMGGLGLVSDAAAMMEISVGSPGLALLDFAGVTDGSITMVKDFKRGTIPATVVNIGSELIASLVKKNNLTLKDIAMIIPQNISKSGWNFYCQVLDFPLEKVFLDNFDDGGHMGDVDIIRNLTEVGKRKLLKPQDFAVIYGIGTGTSWNAILVRAI
jgi:3-oxoacyl-[acyl-carrier-protein] synthase-3